MMVCTPPRDPHPKAAMTTTAQALTQLQSQLTEAVSPALIRRLLRDLDSSWRERTLNPVVTTYLFLQQVLHGNTAVGHLRHLSRLWLCRTLWSLRCAADPSPARGCLDLPLL